MKETPLPRAAGLMMLAAFASALLLHVDRLPGWCVAVAVAALSWQGLHQWRGAPMPGVALRTALAFCLLLATAVTHRSIAGLAAGTTLLAAMGAAKLLEIRGPRDARAMVLVALALLLAACLDRQSLPRVPLYLLAGWVALSALATLAAAREAASVTAAMRTAGLSLLWALPLAVLGFVFVPRMPGALWSMPPDDAVTTGLGDEMSPGSISDLSLSDEVAFRVRFTDPAPPRSQRYWRGPVLHDFDGFTWRRNRSGFIVGQPPEPVSAPLRYRVMLEPTGRNFLFGLDVIGQIAGLRNYRPFDGTAVALRPVTAPIDYDGTSFLQVRPAAPLPKAGRWLDTQLPDDRNPRSLALARELRAASIDERAYARRVLDYFRDQGFRYTLTPPQLGRDSVDDLIFNTRLGFCGHFASAYVTLMRAAGIPARVVTGYLGGEWNPVGGYYVVRQSDAHAWAEVWLEGSGWVRVDPTAVVAPERLRRDLRDLLPESDSVTDRLLRGVPWARSLRDAWDATATWWQQRVVNFNAAVQRDLLRQLGLPDVDYRVLALLLLAGAAAWTLAFWWFGRARRTADTQPDALGRLWENFVALLQRRGLAIAAHEPPRAIAARATRQFPALADEIGRFATCYLDGRFGPDGTPPATVLSAMRHQLRWMQRASRAARRSPAR